MSKSKIILSSLSAVFISLLSFNISYAADNSALTVVHVKNIQGKQAKSIQQGINLGKLTPREARKLKSEQSDINKLERAMQKDGVMTSDELRTLFVKLEKSRKNINRLARNSISTSARTTDTSSARSDQSRITRPSSRDIKEFGR